MPHFTISNEQLAKKSEKYDEQDFQFETHQTEDKEERFFEGIGLVLDAPLKSTNDTLGVRKSQTNKFLAKT